MSKSSFQMFFRGPALDGNLIDVRELSPALFSIGSLIEESNRVLNGDRATVAIKVRSFEGGCFGVDLELFQSIKDQMVNLFTSNGITASYNILYALGLMAGAGKGLLWLIKRGKGRKPLSVKKLRDGNVELVFQNDDVIVINPKVVELYKDLRVRKEVENITAPLGKPGFNSIEFRDKNTEAEVIHRSEMPYFIAPEGEEVSLGEHESIATFSIHSLSFKEDNKWRLSDGTSTFFVTILDEEFLRKVNDNLISFSKGDLLQVRLRIKSWQSEGGLRTEYEVLEVLNHKSAAVQLSLPWDKPET